MPFRPHKTPRTKRTVRSGFALVITIILMVLLSILAVGMLSLSTVSLRASSNGELAALARSNARLSLNLAIGRLQELAGADQRITASSGILADPDASVASSARPHLTGVWKSWKWAMQQTPDYATRKESDFLGQELPDDVAPDGESFLNVLRGQQKPSPYRDSIVVSGNRGDQALKTIDGWKLIDSTGGGGNSVSWDSSNASIANPLGIDQGVPKQFFRQSVDLGEDKNLISKLTDTSQIRSNLTSLTGSDLLAVLDNYRTTQTSTLFPRRPDNDADGMPNSFELAHELDPDNPKDANQDADGDRQSNLDEFIAGTDPNLAASTFKVLETADTPTGFSISWPSLENRQYEVYWTSDLSTWHLYSEHEGSGSILNEVLDKSVMDGVDGVIGNLTRCLVRVVASRP